MYERWYHAYYHNSNGEDIRYTYRILAENTAYFRTLAEEYAMWIMEEFPQSGFILHEIVEISTNKSWKM